MQMKKDTANKLFFSSLYQNISSIENEVIDEDSKKNICLITNEVIEDSDHKIKLLCGHVFKYEAILNSVIHSKYYTIKNKVIMKNNQLQCPYCRNIQDGLLPYIKSYKRVRYVNSPDKYVMKTKTCKYIFKSGKRKGTICGIKCYDTYCNKCSLKREKQKHNSLVNAKDEVIYCKEKIKTGKRQGETCGRKCKNGTTCGIHTKITTNNLNKK